MAIVATLIYAVGEFRQSRALGSTDIEAILYSRIMELDWLVIESEGMAGIVLRANQDPSSLTQLEQLVRG